jgi:hypothetical protein
VVLNPTADEEADTINYFWQGIMDFFRQFIR